MIPSSLYLASVSLMMSHPMNVSPVSAPVTDSAHATPLAHHHAWQRAFASGEAYARGRLGRVSFALIDDQGLLHRYHAARQYDSASVVKAMLLVAYLNRGKIRHHHLGAASRALLNPMIERSDNDAASRVRGIVGNVGLERVARRAGMHHFRPDPNWGNTHIAAADQARFFYEMDRLVPARHRRYARFLLSHVVGPQRWGVPQALPDGRSHVFFKGGWRPEGGGWILHQVARVERGKRRVALAVLTDSDRSFGYGVETVRGISRRVLRPLAQP